MTNTLYVYSLKKVFQAVMLGLLESGCSSNEVAGRDGTGGLTNNHTCPRCLLTFKTTLVSREHRTEYCEPTNDPKNPNNRGNVAKKPSNLGSHWARPKTYDNGSSGSGSETKTTEERGHEQDTSTTPRKK